MVSENDGKGHDDDVSSDSAPTQAQPMDVQPTEQHPDQTTPVGWPDPGQVPHDQIPTGQVPPRQVPPGQFPPGEFPPGQFPPTAPYPNGPAFGAPPAGPPYSGAPNQGAPFPGAPFPGAPFPGQQFPGQPGPPAKPSNRGPLIAGIVIAAVVVVAAVSVGVWALVRNSDSDSTSRGDGAAASASATSPAATSPSASSPSGTPAAVRPSVATGYAFRVSTAPRGSQPPAVVTVFEDLQCPFCKQFEAQFGAALRGMQANPRVAVDYRIISFLDRASENEYSSRAANASACVAESTATGGDWSKWLAFHTLLFDRQPAEGGAGHDDNALNAFAVQAGATDVSACISERRYAAWIAEATQAGLREIEGTPTVKINGTDHKLSTPDALIAAVNQAAGS